MKELKKAAGDTFSYPEVRIAAAIVRFKVTE
jgi:hypothetical protein